MKDYINVIGSGLAGSEAAYQIASRGIKVRLYEMKPKNFSPAHSNKNFAEIVCSNSFKSNLLTNACGLLKQELRILNFTTGGAVLIRDFLNIGNQELRQEFGLDPDQIEYDWTQADVDRVLTTGSMEELEDALDFAPEGIVDMIKSRAVALRIPDMNKRNAIYKKTGADINMQIQYAEKADQNKDKTVETHPTQRRVKKTV